MKQKFYESPLAETIKINAAAMLCGSDMTENSTEEFYDKEESDWFAD